jgi:sulfur carrier protein ThiS
MVHVKVGKIPGSITEVVLEDGAVVADALEAASLSADGYTIKLNGETAATSVEVEDGDEVILTKSIKGA